MSATSTPREATQGPSYNIFYMGINVGALMAPMWPSMVQKALPPEFFWAHRHVFSVVTLWRFKRYVEQADRKQSVNAPVSTAATAVDAPPPGVSHQHNNPIDAIPDSRRVGALIVIFLIVIVFWMVFHQNQTTWTYFANDSIDWNVTGIISNAINPGWVILLTFPLIWFWGALDKRGLEPSTPTKMAIGMCLTGGHFVMTRRRRETGQEVLSTIGGTGTTEGSPGRAMLRRGRSGLKVPGAAKRLWMGEGRGHGDQHK